MGYNLLINGIYWGYNPLTNHLLYNFLGHPSAAVVGRGPGVAESRCQLSSDASKTTTILLTMKDAAGMNGYVDLYPLPTFMG